MQYRVHYWKNGKTGYLSKSGFLCYTTRNAAIFDTKDDAKEDCDYFQKHYPQYNWGIELVFA